GMSMEEADRLMAETGFRVVDTFGLGVLPFNDRINPLGTGGLLAAEHLLSRASLPLSVHQNLIYVVAKA
ncbi:MAG TPA: hypothetical protein VFH27_15675, partial [Longimicrobiaceae bacterium]|nr:hypothetical protein [Longimicrobiaceae bacterium]